MFPQARIAGDRCSTVPRYSGANARAIAAPAMGSLAFPDTGGPHRGSHEQHGCFQAHRYEPAILNRASRNSCTVRHWARLGVPSGAL